MLLFYYCDVLLDINSSLIIVFNMQKKALAILLVGAAQAAQRTFTLRNLCSEPVWFGFSGGAVNARNSTSAQCNSDADCWEGTHCVAASPAISFCFARNPVPADGNYKLEIG